MTGAGHYNGFTIVLGSKELDGSGSVVVVDKWYWIVLEPVWGGVHCKGWFYCLLGGFGFGDKYHKFTTASTVYCTSLASCISFNLFPSSVLFVMFSLPSEQIR